MVEGVKRFSLEMNNKVIHFRPFSSFAKLKVWLKARHQIDSPVFNVKDGLIAGIVQDESDYQAVMQHFDDQQYIPINLGPGPLKSKLAQKFCEAVKLSSKIRAKAKAIKKAALIDQARILHQSCRIDDLELQLQHPATESPIRMQTPTNRQKKARAHRRSFSHDLPTIKQTPSPNFVESPVQMQSFQPYVQEIQNTPKASEIPESPIIILPQNEEKYSTEEQLPEIIVLSEASEQFHSAQSHEVIEEKMMEQPGMQESFSEQIDTDDAKFTIVESLETPSRQRTLPIRRYTPMLRSPLKTPARSSLFTPLKSPVRTPIKATPMQTPKSALKATPRTPIRKIMQPVENLPNPETSITHLCFFSQNRQLYGIEIASYRLIKIPSEDFSFTSRVIPALNGKTIVTGGDMFPNMCWQIDFNTEEIQRLPDMPEGKYWHTAIRFKGYLWIIGGVNQHKMTTNSVWYLEEGVNWKIGPFLNSYRCNSSAVEYKGDLYIAGGQSPCIDDPYRKLNTDTIERLHGFTWELLSIRLPNRLQSFAMMPDSTGLIIMGGKDSENRVVKDAYRVNLNLERCEYIGDMEFEDKFIQNNVAFDCREALFTSYRGNMYSYDYFAGRLICVMRNYYEN